MASCVLCFLKNVKKVLKEKKGEFFSVVVLLFSMEKKKRFSFSPTPKQTHSFLRRGLLPPGSSSCASLPLLAPEPEELPERLERQGTVNPRRRREVVLPQRALEHCRAVSPDRPVVRHRQRRVQRARVVARQQPLRHHAGEHPRERQPRRALVPAEPGEDAGSRGAGRGEDGAGHCRGEGGVEVGVGDELLL